VKKTSPLVGVLQVGPHLLRVVLVDTTDLRDERKGGVINFDANRISLPTEAAASRNVETLGHELCHHWVAGLEIGGAEEEQICNAVGAGLAELLARNGPYVRKLIKALVG